MPDGAATSWCTLDDGVHLAWSVPLCGEAGAAQPEPRPVLKEVTSPSLQRLLQRPWSTFRVIMPKEYCEATVWQTACQRPSAVFEAFLPPGLDVRVGRWRSEVSLGCTRLTVLVKVPEEAAAVVYARSGLKGFFSAAA